ncbi:MAG: hypothetical protein CMM05_01405 [Rhodopirellula sp.]|nr:hypothetical protein [Rhodopirellula sp.]
MQALIPTHLANLVGKVFHNLPAKGQNRGGKLATARQTGRSLTQIPRFPVPERQLTAHRQIASLVSHPKLMSGSAQERQQV